MAYLSKFDPTFNDWRTKTPNTMNTKHTPGPWKKIGYQSVQDARGMEIAWCTVSAQFGKEFAEILTPEAAANARLIAAAPCLLAFAQKVSDGGHDMADLMTEARSVIAKATGETI